MPPLNVAVFCLCKLSRLQKCQLTQLGACCGLWRACAICRRFSKAFVITCHEEIQSKCSAALLRPWSRWLWPWDGVQRSVVGLIFLMLNSQA